MKQRTLIVFFLALVLTFPVFAERSAMPRIAMPTAASNGFGGTHVAYTDNVFSLLVNPAAMIRVNKRSFFNLAPSLMSPQSTLSLITPIIDLAGGDTSALGDAAQILSDKNGKVALGFELREFPLSFAWVANGFGFGLWDRVFVNANIIGTRLEANVYADVMLPVGFAFKVLDLEKHAVDMGVTLKPFVRAITHESVKITELANDSSDLLDNYSAPIIVGGGFDLGFLYRSDFGLQAGITFDDIFSHGQAVYNINSVQDAGGSYYIPFTMNMGVSYHFDVAFFGLTAAADWRDFTNVFSQGDYLDHRNAALDFGIGLELSLFKMIFLRLGMSEMLPSLGLGFDLGPCEIDLAYYGREFGNEPGQLSVATVDLSIAIRPEAEERNWPWARRSLLSMLGVGKAAE